MGDKVPIAVALQVAQEGGHPPVDDHLVQHNLLVEFGVDICNRHITVCTHGSGRESAGSELHLHRMHTVWAQTRLARRGLHGCGVTL